MLDIRLSSLWLALVTGCLQARNRYRKSFYKATCARSSMDRASVFGFIPGCRPRTQENAAITLFFMGLRRFLRPFLIPAKPRKTPVSGVLYTRW